MPIYEYKCEGCQAVFEVFQKVSDPPPGSHECGSQKITRLLSNTSFVLKGTGWYATDYASPNKQGKAEHGDKADKADKSDKADKKSDTKESSGKADKSDSGSGSKKAQSQAAPPSGKGGGGGAAAA